MLLKKLIDVYCEYFINYVHCLAKELNFLTFQKEVRRVTTGLQIDNSFNYYTVVYLSPTKYSLLTRCAP
jgi:hypothetical protein